MSDDWTPEEIRRVGYRVVDIIARHLGGIRERPVFRPYPSALRQALSHAPLPRQGQTADEILDEFLTLVEPYPFGNGHPRFWGWVNSPPAPIGVLAEALAAAMNPSCAGGNHAAIHLERQVVQWFVQLIGLPPSTMGLFVSGGSTAALTALAVARHLRAGFDVRRDGLAGAPRPLVIYQGGEAHGCHQKAIELLGLGSRVLHHVDLDGAKRLSPAALDAAIRADTAAGRLPLAVVASAGTVNTGAIDPLDELADVCARHGVWLHVDGAYGAPALLSTRYGPALRALARCDSLTLDPHKWLYVPVEAGLVLVRDGAAMRDAFALVPPYLRTHEDPDGVGGPPWFSEYGFQQTRAFRALKVWMALKHRGLDGYARAIDHDIALAERLAARVQAEEELELWQPQSLSIVCFRHVPRGKGLEREALNAHNRAVLQRLQLDGRAFLSGTVLDDVFWLRACFVNPGSTAEDVDELVHLVREIASATNSRHPSPDESACP